MRQIKQLLVLLGFNKAILYSLGLRGWQALAGTLTLFLIAHFFTPAQQGFYYTFNSLLMLQIFFEMGLSYVLIQFVSHEFSHIKWASRGRVSGGSKIRRFKTILSKSFYWYSWAAGLFLVLAIPAGLIFLGLKDHAIHFMWRIPYVLLVFTTALNLLIMPFLACVEGSGQVKEVYRLRFFQNLVGTCIAWVVISVGGGLYSALVISLINFLISFSWITLKRPLLLRMHKTAKLKNPLTIDLLSWREEIWPMQWRIAVSWIAGYFINQIFVPILFYYHSPAVAGQMGMSLAISTLFIFVGQAWISAKAPTLGKLVAAKDWALLDATFYKLCLESLTVVICACGGFILVMYLFKQFSLFHRLLPLPEMIYLCASAIVAHMVNCVAQYLRSHKKEPFMVLSVIGAILIAGCAWYFGKYDGSRGIVIATFIVNLCYGLPTALWLWHKKKKAWHHPI